MSTTPNMSIIKPVPLSDSNLVGATEVNSAFDRIDLHDHTTGKGVQIPTLGLNINADLNFNTSYGAKNLASLHLVNRGSSPAGAGYVYFKPGSGGVPYDLWANDGNGTAVQLTLGGAVNVTGSGGISGLAAPATATYSAGSFIWQSNVNTPAICDTGDIVLRKAGAVGPNGITVASPNALAAAYNLTLPTALPASQLPVVLGNAGSGGQLAARQLVTADISAGAVTSTELAASSVTATQLATNAVTTTRILDGAVTKAKLAAATTGAVSANTTVTATTYTLISSFSGFVVTGRPVLVALVPIQGAGTAAIGVQGNSIITTASMSLGFSVNGGVSYIAEFIVQTTVDDHVTGNIKIFVPPAAQTVLALGAGTYTIGLYGKVNSTNATGTVQNCFLYAVEL